MTVKYKRACSGRIAEIHAHLHAVEGLSSATPEWNFDGVAHVLVGSGFAIDFQHLKVNLVHVKSMSLESPVLDGPILDRSHFGGDDGLLIAFEHFLLLSVAPYLDLDRTVGSGNLPCKKHLAF